MLRAGLLFHACPRCCVRSFCLSGPKSCLSIPQKCVCPAPSVEADPGVGWATASLRALCSPHLLPFFCHGQTREQGWSEAPCMHARTHTTSPSPRRLSGALGNGPPDGCPPPWGGRETVWFVTSSKGEAEHTGSGRQASWSQ